MDLNYLNVFSLSVASVEPYLLQQLQLSVVDMSRTVCPDTAPCVATAFMMSVLIR